MVQVQHLDPAVAAKCERLSSLLPVAVRPRLELARREVSRLAPTGTAWDPEAVARRTLTRSFPGLGGMDIDALVTIVMFEQWKAEEQDLREMLDELHRQNQAKQRLRDLLNQVRDQAGKVNAQMRETYDRMRSNGAFHPDVSYARTSTLGLVYPRISAALLAVPTPRPDLTAVQLQSTLDKLNKGLDTLGDLTEEMSLKLQILMERRQKTMQTLSNILKKLGATAETIVSNIK